MENLQSVMSRTQSIHLQLTAGWFFPIIGENRPIVTDEPVEFEKEPVEVQGCRKITSHFRGIYRIYPNLIKET